MYKIKMNNEYKIVLISFIIFLVSIILLIFLIHLAEITEKDYSFILFLLGLSMLTSIILIIYEINLIKKYKWLSKNGILIRNQPFTYVIEDMSIKVGTRYITTVSVEYKEKTGEKLTLSRTWFEKKDFRKYKVIDILIDINNPKKRYYIDFNIIR